MMNLRRFKKYVAINITVQIQNDPQIGQIRQILH